MMFHHLPTKWLTKDQNIKFYTRLIPRQPEKCRNQPKMLTSNTEMQTTSQTLAYQLTSTSQARPNMGSLCLTAFSGWWIEAESENGIHISIFHGVLD